MSRVSYQCSGMVMPRFGTLTGKSRIPGKCFVRLDGDPEDTLLDYNLLRPGEIPPWVTPYLKDRPICTCR